MTTKAYWDFKVSDMGAYVQCTKCKRKIGIKKLIFADADYTTCPDCGSSMNFSRIPYSRIEEEALNECE